MEFKAAVTYENNSSKQKEDGEHLIKCLSIEQGSKVLDLGCGTGQLTKIIADLVGRTGKVRIIDSQQRVRQCHLSL